jgi:hypothetical protein
MGQAGLSSWSTTAQLTPDSGSFVRWIIGLLGSVGTQVSMRTGLVLGSVFSTVGSEGDGP